jgi:hypothetical protein
MSWRTIRTIPAHAPMLTATANQRMTMGCQLIEFIVPPCASPDTVLFRAGCQGQRSNKSVTLRFPQLIPTFHSALIARQG